VWKSTNGGVGLDRHALVHRQGGARERLREKIANGPDQPPAPTVSAHAGCTNRHEQRLVSPRPRTAATWTTTGSGQVGRKATARRYRREQVVRPLFGGKSGAHRTRAHPGRRSTTANAPADVYHASDRKPVRWRHGQRAAQRGRHLVDRRTQPKRAAGNRTWHDAHGRRPRPMFVSRTGAGSAGTRTQPPAGGGTTRPPKQPHDVDVGNSPATMMSAGSDRV